MSKLGVVVVSHVPAIAEGVVTLMKEVAKDVSITFAGGTDDNEVGTSFAKIEAAFEENTGETLLAFYDLGSAKKKRKMFRLRLLAERMIMKSVQALQKLKQLLKKIQVRHYWPFMI